MGRRRPLSRITRGIWRRISGLSALGGNRFNQARVVILDVADPRAHRPAVISSVGNGASRAFSSAGSAGSSPSQTGQASGLSTDMRLCSRAHNSFGRVHP